MLSERNELKMLWTRTKVAWTLLVTLLLCAGNAGAQQNASVKVDILSDIGIDQHLDEQIPLELTFRDEYGDTVALRDYFGEQPVILSLVYYECPMLCSMILNGLLTSLKPLKFEVGKDFQVVTVSFDPTEGPELALRKKESYIQQYPHDGAQNGWHFLTGDEASIKALTEAVGFRYKYNPETKQYAHASGVMVLTPEGKLSKYFYGIEYPSRDLEFGLVEASNNEIGTFADQVLLYCYHYDPTTGKYGVAIMNIIRVLGTLTVVILVSFMVVMLRRDHLKKKRVHNQYV